MELERRKNRDLQDATRERDKEYQKLKVNSIYEVTGVTDVVPKPLLQVQYDKIKRKALLAPNVGGQDGNRLFGAPLNNHQNNDQQARAQQAFGINSGNIMDIGVGVENQGVSLEC